MRKHILALNKSEITEFLDKLKITDKGNDIFRCCAFIAEMGSRVGGAANFKKSHFEFDRNQVWVPE